MRFGMDTAPPILMQELRSVLSSEPWAGVFPTPIQVSDMVRLGFLPLLPQELAIGPYCKDLMRLCDFQYPIGLMQEWVNNPRFFSAKFTGSSRGLLCWHVFVPKAFAREADLILAANLDLRKPSCAPFQAPTHYTRDWQAEKDELVLGKQCPQLQSLIEAMRERTRATRALTAIYRIPIKLLGMLTSAAIEKFGRLTLLRFLLAVIVTGAQAKKAEDAEPTKPPTKTLDVLSDSESSGDDDDDDSPPTFEWTTTIKKSLFASTPKPVEDKKKSLLTAPKSPEDNNAWIDQLAQMDLTKDRPSPLFFMILPAEEDGCYFVVVRQRYLPLAMNVLDSLPSFLQFHLGESSFPNFIRVIKNWSATDLAYQNRKLHVAWVPLELRSRCIDDPTDDQGPQVRDPMDFLLCMEDPVEILEGTLQIDIHAKHVRDVDDGLSVIGYLDDWNKSQAQLQTALQTIETITDEKNSLNRDLQSVRDELEAMKAAQEAAAAMSELATDIRPIPMLTVDVPTGPPGQTRVSTTTVLSPSARTIASPATAQETDGEDGEDQPNASSPMDTGRDGFGDNHLARAPGSARLAFQNINTIPNESDDPKQAQLNHWIQSECGKGFHSAVAYNTHQPRAAHSTTQFGGCSTSAFNKVSHRVRSSGDDSLGRWAWIRLQGRTRGVGQRDLVVISAYRPNPPNDGHQTVWFQHKAHFSRTNRDAEPREAFIKDLSTAINKWRDDGCSIILGIDANDDLSSYSPKSFRFRMSEVGLVEAIQSKHPGSHQATYQRNLRGYPIDGIFATPDVPILAGGYYPFDEHVASDHRGLWIDFDLNSLLGGHQPTKSTHVPRRLVMHNKRVVQRYVQLAEQGYMRYNIPGRLSTLGFDVARQQGVITKSQAVRFDRIHADAYTV
ncbi:unnamed protein product [Cylindrotheca closterium]|uniref:Endonuclease/exonuclease/phosphatase domain-containing protein n=1 Tax=Cylindrotheca closterium TaxID=2856 RepID=A0AAD2FTH3_9STRA|nr:unnamed protein product [Cylindrotheca closterium]